jgi:hypothetical protein
MLSQSIVEASNIFSNKRAANNRLFICEVTLDEGSGMLNRSKNDSFTIYVVQLYFFFA